MPIILLHGGPGYSSYYLKLFEGLEDDRKVVRYDQLGGGKSPGKILGFEYYRAHPEHVASLLFGSPALDIPAWERNANRLLKTIADSGQKAVAEAGKTGKFDSPAYQAANDEFWVKYVMRSAPQPVQADLDSTMSQRNEVIYNYMQGPSEFTIVGTLKKYDGTKGLKEVKVPVSFAVGEFDEANPDIVKRQAAMVPGAKVEVLKGSATCRRGMRRSRT